MNIKNGITKEQVGLILGSRETQLAFLLSMKDVWDVPTKLNRKGLEVIDNKRLTDVTQFIIDNWEYESAKQVLRDMFKNTEKYLRGKSAKKTFNQFYQ